MEENDVSEYFKVGNYLIGKYRITPSSYDDAMGEMAIGYMQYLSNRKNIFNSMKWRLFDFLANERKWNRSVMSLDDPLSRNDERAFCYADMLCSRGLNPEQKMISNEEEEYDREVERQVKEYESKPKQYFSLMGLIV